MKCLKYSMFVFNLLFFLCGAAALGVGIWAAVGARSFRDILTDNPIIFDGVYIIIAIGGALTLIGFLGCFGAVRENRCLLGTYFALVLILFIIEIVGAILIFVYYPQVEEIALNSINQYGQNSTDGTLITQGWDIFQATLGCCGFNNYTEWKDNAQWTSPEPSAVVPDSCCKRDILSLDGTITDRTKCSQGNEEFLNAEGCSVILHNYIWAAVGVGIAILILELLGMIFSCVLNRTIAKHEL